MLVTEELFEEVLVKPAMQGGDMIYIVSGYSTATMASKHLEHLKTLKKNVKISLIIGMCPQDGIHEKDHTGFNQLVADFFPANFDCRYLTKPPPVHSKVYSWFKGGKPLAGFSGSANYTQRPFVGRQREVMHLIDPQQGFEYFYSLIADTIDCRDSEASNFLHSFKRKNVFKGPQIANGEGAEPVKVEVESKFQKVTISFLGNQGELAERSGLNWGQRSEYNRNPNQAYIRVPATIYRTDFFPDITKHFTVLTDDGKNLICVRAQENGKAIESPHNNSLLGEYFRNRLGLKYGSLVSMDDLLLYGRTDVDFYKIDDETYFMDFSIQPNG